MPPPKRAPPPPALKPELTVKAFVIRGFIAELKHLDLLAQVVAKVSPETRQFILEPAPGSTWVDTRFAEELGQVVSELLGLKRWRKISHDATVNTMVPMLRVVIEGFVRLFGATPATLLARLNRITSTSARGVEYDYQPTSPRSGVLTVRYPGRRNVPLSTFFCCAGGVETVFDICRTEERTLADPVMIADGMGNAATMDVRW